MTKHPDYYAGLKNYIFCNYMRYDSKRTVILSGKQYVQTNEKKEKGNQHRDSKTIIAS